MNFHQRKCLHCSFIENIFLVKIQKIVNRRKHIHNNFFPEDSQTIQIQNFDHQNWSDVLYKNIFFFARLNLFLYSWVFKCQMPACRFLNAGFYCINCVNFLHYFCIWYKWYCVPLGIYWQGQRLKPTEAERVHFITC